MDILEYQKLKTRGLAQIISIGKSFAIAWKRIDAYGDETEPEMLAVGVEMLNKIRVECKERLVACDEIEEEMKKLSPHLFKEQS